MTDSHLSFIQNMNDCSPPTVRAQAQERQKQKSVGILQSRHNHPKREVSVYSLGRFEENKEIDSQIKLRCNPNQPSEKIQNERVSMNASTSGNTKNRRTTSSRKKQYTSKKQLSDMTEQMLHNRLTELSHQWQMQNSKQHHRTSNESSSEEQPSLVIFRNIQRECSYELDNGKQFKAYKVRSGETFAKLSQLEMYKEKGTVANADCCYGLCNKSQPQLVKKPTPVANSSVCAIF